MSGRDELDQWLMEAMLAQADAPVPADLAALAMERVRAGEERKAHLARLGRWWRVSCLAAAVVVGAVLLAGYCRMNAGDAGDGTGTIASGHSSGSSDSSSDGEAVGLAILGAAVVGMAGRMVLLPERQVGAAAG